MSSQQSALCKLRPVSMYCHHCQDRLRTLFCLGAESHQSPIACDLRRDDCFLTASPSSQATDSGQAYFTSADSTMLFSSTSSQMKSFSASLRKTRMRNFVSRSSKPRIINDDCSASPLRTRRLLGAIVLLPYCVLMVARNSHMPTAD